MADGGLRQARKLIAIGRLAIADGQLTLHHRVQSVGLR